MAVNTLPPVTAAEFDFYDAEYAKHLMSDLVIEMRIRALSDDELQAFIDGQKFSDCYNEIEGKWEVYLIGCQERDLFTAYAEQERRAEAAELAAARARYTNGPLVHRPFAGLAEVLAA
jgi:hypothetical protein